MPVSKHRRKGKLRPRVQALPSPSWRRPLLPEAQAELDAELAIDEQNTVLILAWLKEVYGGESWPDWQYELAHEELAAQGKLLPVPGRSPL